jgi:hypothetical protein
MNDKVIGALNAAAKLASDKEAGQLSSPKSSFSASAQKAYILSLAAKLETLQPQRRSEKIQEKLADKIHTALERYHQGQTAHQAEQNPSNEKGNDGHISKRDARQKPVGRQSYSGHAALSQLPITLKEMRTALFPTQGENLQFSLFTGGHEKKPTQLRALNEMRRFRTSVNRSRRIHHAIQRTPEGAGPLNAHRQLSQSIELLQSIAPDYLVQLLNYVDTLTALEGITQAAPNNKRKAKQKR